MTVYTEITVTPAFSFSSKKFMACCFRGVKDKTPTIFNTYKLILSSTARLKICFFLNGTTLTQALVVASGSGSANVCRHISARHSSSIALALEAVRTVPAGRH